jgi:hypothetical protein
VHACWSVFAEAIFNDMLRATPLARLVQARARAATPPARLHACR